MAKFILQSKTVLRFILDRKEFLIGLILCLSLLWPLLAAPFFNHHDDVQVIRLFEMDKCFKDHQIPCRWVPDLGGLYGYPIFNYYGPLPYYFGEIIYLVTSNFIWTAKIMFAFSFIGSYVFMYLLARKFFGSLGGSISATFYAFAPYHALDFYVRGAMGEMWALMLFPAVFWGIAKLETSIRVSNLLLTAILLACLIMSHNLSTMIFLPFIFIWVILLFFIERKKKFLLYIFMAFFLSICLAAFYAFPMIVEKNLVHIDTTTSGYFYFTEHFKGVKKLFLERSWGYGSSIREVPGGERDKLSYQIGWIHLVGMILALISLKFLWRKEKIVSRVIIFCSGAILLAVFMIHPRSEFVWKAIEPLKYLQFPWRFLLLVIFFTSFLSGGIFWLQKKENLSLYDKKIGEKLWLLLMLLVVVLNFSYFKPEKFLNIDDKEYLSGQNWDKVIKRSIFDYLPIYAKEPPAELATERYKILTGDTRLYDFKEGTNWISFKTETRSHTIIRLSQYYFPDWKIFVDGKEIKFDYQNNSLGLMNVILGEGNHEIYARLFDTPIRSISNMITLSALTIILLLFVYQFDRVKRWVGYYRKRIH